MKKEKKEVKSANKQNDISNSEPEIDLSKAKVIRSLDDLRRIELDRVLSKREKLSDAEIEKLWKSFEQDFRDDIEKKLKTFKESFETLLKDQVEPVSTQNESKRFLVVVYSENTMTPIFNYWIEADISEAEMALNLRNEISNLFKSREVIKNQYKEYLRLRKRGLKPKEIFPKLDARYLGWDKTRQEIFANKFNSFYSKLLKKKKVAK